MELNVVVCDDNLSFRQEVLNGLKRISGETGIIFHTLMFTSGESLLKDYPENTDLLILDIALNNMTGIEVAQKLRKENNNVGIFFLTNMDQYVFEGYDVHAFAFLLKPLQYDLFKMKILEYADTISKKKNRFYEFKGAEGLEIIDLNKVIYLECIRHKVILHFKNESKEYSMSDSFETIEEDLRKFGFFRTQRSYIVNMSKVNSLKTKEVLMSNGESVPLSPNKYDEFLMGYSTFLNN